MEKIVEVTEEIEKKGTEILRFAQEKVKEILDLAENEIKDLRSTELQKVDIDINKLYKEFQSEISKEMKKLLLEKDKKVKAIYNLDTSNIDVDNLIIEDILEL
jgi:vacuolar-type H+-ATPase subunit E/Vma4